MTPTLTPEEQEPHEALQQALREIMTKSYVDGLACALAVLDDPRTTSLEIAVAVIEATIRETGITPITWQGSKTC